MVGLDKPQQDAASAAAAAAFGTFKAASVWMEGYKGFFAKEGAGFFTFGKTGILGLGPAGLGLIAGAVAFALLYKDEKQEIVRFDCLPWEAPVGGRYCEECNRGKLPCSEYRCHALGQACSFEDEKCIWKNPRDTTAPEIKPWEDVLTTDYKYASVSRDGLKIIREGGNCIKAFTPITFGISTNEPSRCKIDYEHKKTFDEMEFYVGSDNLLKYNHTQVINLPSPESIEAVGPEIKNDGQYTLYVRCQDVNGNYNEGNEYAIRFCVDKGPDLTPPEIVATSVKNNMPVAYDQTEIELEVYTNEPSNCKWSRTSQRYEDMETDMQCSNKVWEMNANLLYKCTTTLTGIKNKQENKYYFRCEDQPWLDISERNRMLESFPKEGFTIIGTEQLDIIEVKPEADDIITGATDVVELYLELKTFGGYNEGQSICYYSETGESGDYTMFFETDSHTHKQRQDLSDGEHTYYFKCIDLGGNEAQNQTSFNVKIDTEEPNIIRVYKESEYLKIITDEESECVYSTDSCTFVFEDGVNMEHMRSGEKRENYAPWKQDQTYYIKCRDKNGREPTACSIVVRPSMIK